MDYLSLLMKGAVGLTMEDFTRLLNVVVLWLVRKGHIDENDAESATDVLDDIINIHAPTVGRKQIRADIIRRAKRSRKPDLVCLSGLRKAVLQEVNRGRFSRYQRSIYRQVKVWVRNLERKGVLQSEIRLREFKKTGLRSWGPQWLQREPRTDFKTVISQLPAIMCYQGQNGTEREPKIFDYCELESFIPRLCDLYGAPLKMGEISWVVEQKLYPPLYHYGKEIPWPEYFGDESVEEGFHASSRDLLACSEFSWEEELLAHDVLEKLGPSLTSDEDRIRQGLEDGESMRSLAELCGCSPGTVEHRRQELARKAARLDPSVQDASDYLERRSQRENDSSLKKRRRDGG